MVCWRSPPLKNAVKIDVEDYIGSGMISSSKRVMYKGKVAEAPLEIAMNKGPRNRYINTIDKMLSAVGQPPSVSAKEREEIYLDDVSVRQTIILRNADSLACFAMAQHRFK